MNDIIRECPVGDRPEIVIAVFSTDIDVVEGPAGLITVEIDGPERDRDLVEVIHTGDVVTIRARKGGRRWIGRGSSVHLTIPAATTVTARTASGDLRFSVPISDAEINVSSGDVHLASLSGRGRIKAASGDVTIGDVAGGVRISTASGDIRIDEINGDASMNTSSGDIRVGDARGSLNVRTASGDVTIRQFSGVTLDGGAMSGDFDIGLVPGMSIDADIQTRSGEFTNLTSPSTGNGETSINATMRIKTMSGDITLR
ncbi:MAG: DUF4097 family beta strand repeat-containing protein [Actinomycetota bacterium]|nr:DUF4097 family beta strand repeat-containing protein [Actinomycetota bacterium]